MDLEALARIGKGTKRKKRDINLLDLAEEIKCLYSEQRSLEKVSKIVKLSPEMIREFLKITELKGEVKELIKLKKITSVDIGYRISKLSTDDQIMLARYIVDKGLSSDDVRSVVKYKKDNPKMPIDKAIDRIIQSKDKKVYVAYLGIEKHTFKELLLEVTAEQATKMVGSIFNGLVPDKSIVSFELNGRVVILKVLKEGLVAIRNRAKKLKVALPKLADAVVREYLEKIRQ